MSEQQEEKPCAGCPWLAKNQTPAAIAKSPVDGSGGHWFDHDNIRRHWEAVAEGGSMLPCHETAEHAPLYGGHAVKPGVEGRLCVGLSILARREVLHFMRCGNDFRKYKTGKADSGRRFSLQALASWATRFVFVGAILDAGSRQLRIPKVADDPRCTLPWRDKLHSGRRRP